MNTSTFKEKTSLHYFCDFVNSMQNQSLPPMIEVLEEDWGNMCGITLINKLRSNGKICFNFYEDGQLRALIFDDK